MLRFLLMTVLLLGAVEAEAKPTVRHQVAQLLSAYDRLPDRSHFLALGPEAPQLLLELAADPALFPAYRARALVALAYFPSPQVELIYREILRAPEGPLGLRRQAIQLYARVFPETANQVLAPSTRSHDPELRRTAEAALQKLNVPETPE